MPAGPPNVGSPSDSRRIAALRGTGAWGHKRSSHGLATGGFVTSEAGIQMVLSDKRAASTAGVPFG